MEGAGSLEGALDTRQPRGRKDSPGDLLGELLGKAVLFRVAPKLD
jgi:hypothetical protein